MVHGGCWVNFPTRVGIWKYRHSVKENQKHGYDWSATRQRLCVSTRTLRISKTLCSVRDNPKTHRSVREISCETGIRRSPAQVCQTTSCTGVVWSQSHRTAGFMRQLEEPRSDTSIPAVCYARAQHSAGRLWCPLPCQKWEWLNRYLSTLGWRWTASITTMSCCFSRYFQQ